MTWISPIARFFELPRLLNRRLDIGLDIATSTGHSLTGQQDSRCRVQIPPCPIESEWGKEGTNEVSSPRSLRSSTRPFLIRATTRHQCVLSPSNQPNVRSGTDVDQLIASLVSLVFMFTLAQSFPSDFSPLSLSILTTISPHVRKLSPNSASLLVNNLFVEVRSAGEGRCGGGVEEGRVTIPLPLVQSFRPSTKDSPVNLLSSFLPIHRLHHTLFNPSLENQNVHCPSTDGSCAGLVDSISISLGSAFPKLGKSALHLLDATLRLASDDDRIRVAESSLLSQVLPKFMHSDLTTSASVPMCLIRIVMTLLELSIETRKISVVGLSEEAVVGIHQTVFDNILVPSAGFVLVLFRQRYSVSPHEDFVHFAGLLSTLFKIAKFRASASTHAFPLPLSLLLTGCLMSLEPTSHIHSILLIVSDSFRRWTNDAQEETKMQQGAFWRDAESEGFEDIAESMRLLADI